MFQVGDQMRGGVAREARIEGTGVRRAPPAVPLIEEHETVGAGIKKPAVPGRTSRTRAAVQDDGWFPMWIATGLPVDEIATINLQEALLIRLDLRIQIGHDSPASHSSTSACLSSSFPSLRVHVSRRTLRLLLSKAWRSLLAFLLLCYSLDQLHTPEPSVGAP